MFIFGVAVTVEFDANIIGSLGFDDIVGSELGEELEANVTRDEIIATLASIGYDKAPRTDLFNSFF